MVNNAQGAMTGGALSTDQEEQFVLRFEDAEVAARVRGWMQSEEDPGSRMELKMSSTGREGVLVMEGMAHPVTVQRLPTVVETFKTFDDTNLVKIADVGEVLVVGKPGTTQADLPEESTDGVTPAMRNVRAELRRPSPPVDPQAMAALERDLLAILAGKAPHGWTFEDIEEEYVVDPRTGEGSWQPVEEL